MIRKKSLRMALTVMALAVGLPAISHADVDDDLDELRGTNSFSDWQLVKHDTRRNIKAYTKREDGKGIRSFKLDYLVDAPFMTLARVYLDFDNYTRWFWTARETHILKKVSPTEFFYYAQHDAPVGQPDRDAIIHVMVDPYTARKGYGALRLKADSNYMPPKPPLVRMTAYDMVVKFTPISDEQVRVEVEGFIDPGGNIPAWAINAVQRQAPYYTVLGLQRMVKLPKYSEAKGPLPFNLIQEN